MCVYICVCMLTVISLSLSTIDKTGPEDEDLAPMTKWRAQRAHCPIGRQMRCKHQNEI